MSAVFALESFLRVDVGGAGRFPGDTFFARASHVGLKGSFGSVTLGRNGTPLFVTTLLTNAFGDSFGFSPSIRQLFIPSGGMLPSSVTPPGTTRSPTRALRGVACR